jgi:hypothetical protein
MPDNPVVDEATGEALTLDEANALDWRELDVSALEAQVDAVWETVASMLEAQTVSRETLTCEISV